MLKSFILIVVPILITSNVWDNIFSKPRSIPTIRFQQEFSTSFKVKAEDKQYQVKIDYNLPEYRINAAISMQNDFFIKMMIKLGDIEINLQKKLIIIQSLITCNNYELPIDVVLPQNSSYKVLGAYLETFFEFLKQQNKFYSFKFNPNLINSFSSDDVPNVVLFTDQKGDISKIQVNQQKINFEWKSQMKSLKCNKQVQKLSEIDKMFDFLKQSNFNEDIGDEFNDEDDD